MTETSRRQKYLQEYAEALSGRVQGIKGQWQYVLCVPAFAEDPSVLETFKQSLHKHSVLLIMVVNAPESASMQQKQQTRRFLEACQDLERLQSINDQLSLYTFTDQADLLLVDCSSSAHLLPEKKGVGLARKIAADLALALIEKGNISSPWLFCTDADVTLHEQYFSAVERFSNAAGIAALLVPFEHTPAEEPDLQFAQGLYDFSLHYYVEGLRTSGSAYAFHTIGSTMVINSEAYCIVRGFPQRPAAEDFYMLSKLRKAGKVVTLSGQAIGIQSRLSDRVPFGTGPALQQICNMTNPVQEYLFYHPDCFRYLQILLYFIPRCWQLDWSETQALFIHVQQKQPWLDTGLLISFLNALNFETALNHAKEQGLDRAQYMKHMQAWLDGFRTLKFIHEARDTAFPSVPLINMTLQSFVQKDGSASLRLKYRALFDIKES